MIATADADAPATESTSSEVKRAAKLNVLPCNIAGTSETTLTYGWKSKK